MPPDESKSSPSFREAMTDSLGRLQVALREGLSGTSIADPGPTTIANRLGIDKSTAWKIGRIVRAEPPLQTLDYMPGAVGARNIVASFREAGLASSVCKEMGVAFEEVHRDIREYAGDRSTAQTMARVAQSEEAVLDLNLRRSHFRTAAPVWGARARVQLKTDFLGPVGDSSTLFTAGFEGLFDFQSLQPGVRWRLGRKRHLHHDELTATKLEPLDPKAGGPGAVPLFTDYCSSPPPAVSVTIDSAGFTNYEFEPGEIGKKGAMTCLIATINKEALLDREEDDNIHFAFGVHVRTPVEHLVLDYFVHKSLIPKGSPSAGLYAQVKNGPPFPETGSDHPLSVGAEVEELPPMAASHALLGVPNYPSMLREAARMAAEGFGCAPWALEDFNGYRLRIAYPPVPSFGLISISFKPRQR